MVAGTDRAGTTPAQAWKAASPHLERDRRESSRRLDAYTAFAWLCGPADYRTLPRALNPGSGLVEQQCFFQQMRGL